VGPGRGAWGKKSPSGAQGQSPGRESGGRSPPEPAAKCEISIQFLSFSCTKNLDLMSIGAQVGQ